MWYGPAQNAVRGTWYANELFWTRPGESTPGTAGDEEDGVARAGEEREQKKNAGISRAREG